MTHTKGPWRTHLTDDTLVIDADGLPVATMDGNYIDGSHAAMEANARLIAAAPDLLEAMQAILVSDRERYPQCNLLSDDLARAKAAVAKATGET